jgi:ABC-type branched-subunit amino acid transport system substrate-binding protein
MTKSSASMAGPAPGSNRLNVTSILAGFALGAVVASLAWVRIVPADSANNGFDPNDFFVVGSGGSAVGSGGGRAPAEVQAAEGPQQRVITEGEDSEAADVTGGGVNVGGDGAGGGASGGSSAGAGERSGSATGVSANKIKLGATYVSDGLACAFLCEVRDAMEAVRSRVNSEGGIHGRQLDIAYKPDGWNPTTGARFLENLIVQDKVFAFAVSPSSEGLNAAARAGLFERHGVPVVGADGLNNSQFIDVKTGKANPWIWPVATATTTNVHIIMKDAWDRSGSTKDNVKLHPAIVFGNTYRFGVEGAYAFNQAYRELSGKDIPGYNTANNCQQGSRYCGIRGDWNGGGETATFEGACGCNFVLVLLEPGTALNWMAKFSPPDSVVGSSGYGMAGAQPLFTTNFGDGCKKKCDGMVIWTGYNPPIGGFNQQQAVADYTRALTAQKASADVNNQFTLGGYIGMELLVKALEGAGKDLDRGKLVQVLNSLSLETGLTAAPKLSWSADQKYANNQAHGFRMTVSGTQGTFSGFERTNRGYVADPWLGQHNQPPT